MQHNETISRVKRDNEKHLAELKSQLELDKKVLESNRTLIESEKKQWEEKKASFAKQGDLLQADLDSFARQCDRRKGKICYFFYVFIFRGNSGRNGSHRTKSFK